METLLTKRFREFLPQIYQKSPTFGSTEDFLDKYLSVFESVISEMLPVDTGSFDLPNEGVEQILARVHEFFSPWTAPGTDSSSGPADHELRNFLDWLAAWGGLLQKAALDEKHQRRALARVIPLYKRRGTKSGLKDYLEIFTGHGTVKVLDTDDELAEFISTHSIANPEFLQSNNFTFAVSIDLQDDPEHVDFVPMNLTQDEYFKLLLSIVLREKPAHTDALVGIVSEGGFIVGVVATVGVDTFLGKGPLAFESVNGVELG